jgi:aspartyl-tRNA(Asn)/glutamyl-tRNA(Gln) amidotransferase subunit A
MPPEWDTTRAWVWELPTFPFSFTRQPALSVPCGFTSEGLPVGLQIVGPVYGDAYVLRAGNAYQSAFPTTDRWPSFDHNVER